MITRSRRSVLVTHVPPKKEPEFATPDGGGGDGGGTGGACLDTDDCYDYGSPEEEPKSECIDIYYHPVKEEPETKLGDGDGDAVVVNGICDSDSPEEESEAELPATSDDDEADGGRDVGYDCSHCGISLGTRKFKVQHELRCKIGMERKELESQVTKLYHCSYCRCPFVNEEFKEQHQRRGCPKRPVVKKKPSNGPYFGCDKCKYVTKWKQSLERHLLTHNKTDAEWFTCTHCSYKTVHKYTMTTHMKVHGNTVSCCCPICGKSFQRKMGLDDHLLRRHSDESDEVAKLITNKVYTCDICDRFRTTSKTNFNVHLTAKHLKDVGRQKYECPRCPYSTYFRGNLTVHSKTHAEQKDYRCTACKKQFAQKKGLDTHILYIHAKNVDLMKTITTKIYRCESCSFRTVALGKFKRHVQSKHT